MFFGWWVVACTFLIAVWGSGLGLYGLSVYLVVLQERNGWSASTVAFGIAGYFLIGAALMTGLGTTMGRLGPRRTVLLGIGAMAAGVFGLTWVTQVWQLYLAFAVMAVGWATMSNPTVNMLLAPWFERRRGLAVSLALTGATSGGMIVAPLLVPVIGAVGFRAGVGIAALVMLSTLVPFAFLTLGRTPANLGVFPDGGTVAPQTHTVQTSGQRRAGRAEAIRTQRFWTLSVGFAFAMAAQVGLLTHLVAYLAPFHGKGIAALALSVVTLSALITRIASGALVDRYDRRLVACAWIAVQALGVLCLMGAESPVAMYAGCVLFGSGVGSVTTLPHLLVHREFRPDQFAGVVGLVSAILQVTFAFSPGLLGALRDATGSYRAALIACVGFQIAAVAVIGLGRLRGVNPEASPASA